MAGFRDQYDQAVTTTSDRSLAAYVDGLDRLVMSNARPDEPLLEAIEDDQGFALAHAALALVRQSAGRIAEARDLIGQAEQLVAGATPREQAQVALFGAAINGKVLAALDGAREHLHQYPRDALVLRQTRFWLNQSGRILRKQEGLAFSEACASALGEDAWFLCHHSFMHNELFHFDESRALAERSLVLNPRISEGAHSMAHVLFETGDFAAGRDFLSTWLDGSAWQEQMRGHLSWHGALFAIEEGDWPAVSRIYDGVVRADRHPGQPQIALADSASLLWRYLLAGEASAADDVEPVSRHANEKFPNAGNAFADAHKAIAYALQADNAAIEALANDCRALVEAGRLPAGPVVPAIIDAIGAFGRGDFVAVIARLEPYADEIVRVGGSHAQFDVFNDTLLAAYVRAGYADKAAPLILARLERRPSARDEAMLAALASPAI